jgi:hypothetical protein
MHGVRVARAAVFFKLELAGRLFFIFGRIVILALALRARQRHYISHGLQPDKITELYH